MSTMSPTEPTAEAWYHRLNAKKFASKIGFAGALLGLSTADIDGAQRVEWSLALLVALTSLVLLFEQVSDRPKWKGITSWVENDFDLTYVSAGLGLMIGGIKSIAAGWFFIGILVIAVGVILAAYLGIGQQLLGKPVVKMARRSAQAAVVVGALLVIGGGLWAARCLLMRPMSQDLWTVIPFAGVGVLAIYAGMRRMGPAGGADKWTD